MDLQNSIDRLREKNPLLHHITNTVTINDCANISLALGGSPIMAADKLEVSDIVRVSDALVLNIGTIEEETMEAMIIAGKEANKRNIPIVLDPVGLGVSQFRKDFIDRLLAEVKISIIKGNQGEIAALLGDDSYVKGVDSLDYNNLEGLVEASKSLARKEDTVVITTGGTDIVTDGEKVLYNRTGHRILKNITGTGCMTNSLIACFLAVEPPLEAAYLGVNLMGRAGEGAFLKMKEDGTGLGSFRVNLIDEVSKISGTNI